MAARNILGSESSPYLLQHANNPVHWQSWEKTDFDKLKKENKLLLISIGYATCHWCHVMERECFESNDVAQLMNGHFHAIKIDREERPDLDQIYMQALQLLTGQGGWPLNIVALPDGRPIWGATYLPKDQWMAALEKIVSLQQQKPDYLLDYAEQFEMGLMENQSTLFQTPKNENKIHLEKLIDKMLVGIDLEWGGYQAPKFPMPVLLQCFLYAGICKHNSTALTHVEKTLEKMALGGLHDHVDGGFSRYSVDHKWHIPHFEKMAYDNGQLLSVFSLAYRNNPLQHLKDSIDSIFQFIQQELKSTSGGYFCALDADSLNEKGELKEGAFYTWQKQELKAVLEKDYPLFKAYYNINENGIWEEDNYVLFATQTPEVFSKSIGLSLEDFLKKRNNWLMRLSKKRKLRTKPLVDNKILIGWNALIATGLCDAFGATENNAIGESAKELLDFLIIQRQADGSLSRVWQKSAEGFLEDYALSIEALIKGYQTFFKMSYLLTAKSLFEKVLVHFSTHEHAFYSYQNQNQSDTLFNPIELEDNVIPSSNAVMTENQWWLGRYFDRQDWVSAAENRYDQMSPKLMQFPRGYGRWIRFGMYLEQKKTEMVVTGRKATSWIHLIHKSVAPHVLVAICDSAVEAKQLTLFNNRFQNDSTQFFICQNNSCLRPTEKASEAFEMIQSLNQ